MRRAAALEPEQCLSLGASFGWGGLLTSRCDKREFDPMSTDVDDSEKGDMLNRGRLAAAPLLTSIQLTNAKAPRPRTPSITITLSYHHLRRATSEQSHPKGGIFAAEVSLAALAGWPTCG